MDGEAESGESVVVTFRRARISENFSRGAKSCLQGAVDSSELVIEIARFSGEIESFSDRLCELAGGIGGADGNETVGETRVRIVFPIVSFGAEKLFLNSA